MPKVVDHESRRRDVVQAASSVIAEEGLEAATVRRLAARMGCATGRITHYFPDKHAILVAVLRAVHRDAAARMATVVEGSSGSDRLRAVVAQALPLDPARLAEWRVWLAFWGSAATDPALRAEQVDRYAEWTRLLSALMAGLAEAPPVDELVALVDGLGLRAALDPTAFPAVRQLRIVDGYLARPAS